MIKLIVPLCSKNNHFFLSHHVPNPRFMAERNLFLPAVSLFLTRPVLKVDRANEDMDPKVSPSGPFLASLVTEWHSGLDRKSVV